MRKLLSFFLAVLALNGFSAQNVKTVNGVAIANVKTIDGVTITSVKTVLGVDNTGGAGGWTGVAVQVQPRASTSSSTSFIYSWGTTPITGNDIWLFVASDATVSTPIGWTPDVSNVNSQGQYVFHKIAAAESSSVTLTIGASTSVVVYGVEYAGLPALSFDKSSVQPASGSGSNCPISATAALAQTAEICFVSICWNNTAGPLTSHSFASEAFTYVGQTVSTGSAVNIGQAYGVLIVSATTGIGTTDTYTGTTTNGQGLIGTYKHN